MTRRYRATTFSIDVADALAIAACRTDDGMDETVEVGHHSGFFRAINLSYQIPALQSCGFPT